MAHDGCKTFRACCVVLNIIMTEPSLSENGILLIHRAVGDIGSKLPDANGTVITAARKQSTHGLIWKGDWGRDVDPEDGALMADKRMQNFTLARGITSPDDDLAEDGTRSDEKTGRRVPGEISGVENGS